MQSAYPAGRDIYLSALVFILRQMVRFWQTGLPEIAAFDRPRAACLQGSLGFASGQSATPNLAELVQLRSRGSTTTGTLPSPTGQAGCTELVPLYFCRPPPPLAAVVSQWPGGASGSASCPKASTSFQFCSFG
jgi:hypothetical protein